MRRRQLLLAPTTLLVCALALAGCSSTGRKTMDDIGLSYTPRNIAGVPVWPSDVRRVAVLPVADATHRLPLHFVANYDGPWREALQQSQRAEFVLVDRDNYRRWTGLPHAPASTSLLPADWAADIQRATGADAAMLLDITHCSPYPPLALGLRAKLVRLDTGAILWSADEVFDAAESGVARGARRFARAGGLSREGEAISVLQSPGKFASYVMEALVPSLPKR